jgi:hypothetical protein
LRILGEDVFAVYGGFGKQGSKVPRVPGFQRFDGSMVRGFDRTLEPWNQNPGTLEPWNPGTLYF